MRHLVTVTLEAGSLDLGCQTHLNEGCSFNDVRDELGLYELGESIDAGGEFPMEVEDILEPDGTPTWDFRAVGEEQR